MKKRQILKSIILSILVIGSLTGCASNKEKAANDNQSIELLNVSYDPTREFYNEINEKFIEKWKSEGGKDIKISQSHGGSGKQARSVIEGLEADVVTLALGYDIDAISNVDIIDPDWQSKFKDNSSPYTSTIVFLVRKGNPKNIKDWDDLIKPNVNIITPNPKSSGGACWNFLAAWAYAKDKYNGDESEIKDFVRKIYKNVSILDSGARSATTTFVENGQGDVLISWENEAYLSLKEHQDEYEIITPSVSILAQPSVAVVDENARKNNTEEVSKEYLKYLYSDEAQEIAAKNYYRPTNKDILQKYSDVFDLNTKLFTIDDFGGWNKVYEEYFKDGAIFDEIYKK